MTVNKFNGSANCNYIIAIILCAAFFVQSCNTKHAFSTSSIVPAAEGSVKVKKDKNKNYSIDLSVNRLADPKRLTPAREVYIVWIETKEQGNKNIGQLITSSGFLSNSLKSSLRTVTSFKPTSIFITAEDNPEVQYPGGQEVLRTASNF